MEFGREPGEMKMIFLIENSSVTLNRNFLYRLPTKNTKHHFDMKKQQTGIASLTRSVMDG